MENQKNIICLKDLYLAQAKLDETIANNHHVTYASTHNRRILALLVELGEFANTTRCFKYWSNKGMEDKATVLDEYADGLHFLLSLGIDIGIDINTTFNIDIPNKDLSNQILLVYKDTISFLNNSNMINYLKTFSDYLNIIPLLGYHIDDALEAYFKKLGVNYIRQETNY